MTGSAVCSSILVRNACQARLRKVANDILFSSSVQLKPDDYNAHLIIMTKRAGCVLLAFDRYDDSALSRTSLNIRRI